MKRIFLIFCISLLSVSVYSQRHFSFMGIPLTGTINQFQQKLHAKGVRHDRQLSASMPVGTRCFKGTFSGYSASIAVYYDETTKQVYAAKAYVDELSEGRADEIEEAFHQNIRSKYGDQLIELSSDTYLVTDTSGEEVLGIIYIYRREDETYYNYPYMHSVHIQYNDAINTGLHENRTLEDY